MRPRPLPVVLVFALVASAIGGTGAAATGATSTGATTIEPAASTTTAAKKENRAPVIVQATMLDSDGNFYADGIELVYSRKVRHKPDDDGTFPFSVGDGYTITKVGKAGGKNIVIQLEEKALPDLPDGLAAPVVTYQRTKSKPVMSKKKFPKQTKKCRKLKKNNMKKWRKKCRKRVQARNQDIGPQPFGGFFLTVERTGDGTVMSVPLGIDCGDTCSAVFPAGAPVVLETLVPDVQLQPTWGGDCSGATGPICQLTMDSNKSVTVVFEGTQGPGGFALTVSVIGPGAVQSVPPGIECPSSCEAAFDPNTPVVLTALPGLPALFDGWGGDCAIFAVLPVCTLMMDGDKTVSASFSAFP
jgi:hypothetical protein